MQTYLRRLFFSHKCEVISSFTIEDCMASSNQQGVDLVLFDLDRFDGAQDDYGAHLIQQCERNHVPVVVLSALTDQEQRVKWLNSGAVDYVFKPFSREDFLARIGVQLRLRRQHKTLTLENTELSQEVKKLERLAIVDGLTGLYNHRFFQERLRAEVRRSLRYGAALSLIMCDIDHFKKINDTHGHPVGDAVLAGVSEALKAKCRASDLPARYGGEEFVVILPEVGLDEAFAAAERMREMIRLLEFMGLENKSFSVTASFGIATLGDDVNSPAELIETADNCLYIAKSSGRNRTIASQKKAASAR